jgi:predicted nuclease of restriction endonuclease-like (RecB) superfamily
MASSEPAQPGGVDYAAALAEAKALVQAARTRAVLAANAELIGLYWRLGHLILDRQVADGWGAKVVERLSRDLRAEFSGMRGLSPTNLDYMRRFAAAWPGVEIPPQLVGRLPWGHVRELLDKLDTSTAREWYAGQAVEHGWSRAVLANQIMSQLHERAGRAPSNFAQALPAGDSELMQQLTKDPYHLEFLTLAVDVAERDLEAALVAQVERFLLELGAGFAFVGRQWRLDLDGDEFFIDLLMFHIPTNRYVVLELKTTKLTPADVGQLNFYVAAVDGEVRLEHHAPTVGLLLCATRNERTVRYALARSTSPMAIAGYRYSELPPAEQAVLPAEAEIVDAVSAALDRFDPAADES